MSQDQNQMICELYADCSEEDLIIHGLGTKQHEKAYNGAMNSVIKPHGLEVKQVGGNHYLNKIQPWDIIDSWELNFYEGNVLKYLLRRKDNRVQDLQKLIHYAERLLELELLK